MQKPEPVIKVISEILKSEDPYIMAHRERMICSVSFVKQSCKMDEVKTILNIGAGEWGPFNRLWAAVFPNAQITLSEGDLRDMLPYSSESFDFVICTEVFEHIAERDLRDGQANFTGILNLLSEIGRLLKRGGECFLTTPNICSCNNLSYMLHGSSPFMCPLHYREYTRYEIEKALKICGLEKRYMEAHNVFFTNKNPLEKLERMLKEYGFPTKDRGDDWFVIFTKPEGFAHRRWDDAATAFQFYPRACHEWQPGMIEFRNS